jgi:CRISPR-associated protein Csb1
VFPPTFAGAVYAVEKRRIPGRAEPVPCVLLDSVQSQANRMELALQEAVDAGRLKLPLVVVDFSEFDPTGDIEADEAAGRLIEKVGRITSLQVPHRLADAIFRDSELDGVRFRRSERGKALNTVSLSNATPLFELCPTALIFGMWDSTGPKGGLGPKFERAMVSEIVGIGAQWEEDYRNRGVRRDPLEISKNVPVFRDEYGALQRVAETGEKKTVRDQPLERTVRVAQLRGHDRVRGADHDAVPHLPPQAPVPAGRQDGPRGGRRCPDGARRARPDGSHPGF